MRYTVDGDPVSMALHSGLSQLWTVPSSPASLEIWLPTDIHSFDKYTVKEGIVITTDSLLFQTSEYNSLLCGGELHDNLLLILSQRSSTLSLPLCQLTVSMHPTGSLINKHDKVDGQNENSDLSLVPRPFVGETAWQWRQGDYSSTRTYWIMHMIFDRSHVTVCNKQALCCCQQDSLQAYIGRMPSCHPAQTHRLQ